MSLSLGCRDGDVGGVTEGVVLTREKTNSKKSFRFIYVY